MRYSHSGMGIFSSILISSIAILSFLVSQGGFVSGDIDGIGTTEIFCIGDSCLETELLILDDEGASYIIYMPPGIHSNAGIGSTFQGINIGFGG